MSKEGKDMCEKEYSTPLTKNRHVTSPCTNHEYETEKYIDEVKAIRNINHSTGPDASYVGTGSGGCEIPVAAGTWEEQAEPMETDTTEFISENIDELADVTSNGEFLKAERLFKGLSTEEQNEIMFTELYKRQAHLENLKDELDYFQNLYKIDIS